MNFIVKELATKEQALTNQLFPNRELHCQFVQMGAFFFRIQTVALDGPMQVMTGGIVRKMLSLQLNTPVRLIPVDCGTVLQRVVVSLAVRGEGTVTLSEAQALDLITTALRGHLPSPSHIYVLQHHSTNINVIILETSNFGVVTSDTHITLDQLGAQVHITDSAQPTAIFKRSVDMKSIGIGGLDAEFLTIFRKVFASRRLPPKIQKELGISHVRGLLLYGPPGTGKTLLARELGKLLDCVEPIIVNGPSLLNKYVGQSEENVRQLFAPAMAAQKAGKDQLHLIICDEFDAIGKKRGSDTGSSGVADNVVNSFLPMIDGIHALNNILVIGITNRIDLIDEALLRSGRFEVKLEIKLPSRDGRLEILQIHTRSMQAAGRLDPSVQLDRVADMTQNYSGAELAGLIRAATSFAVARELSLDQPVQDASANPVITMTDIVHAVAETVPALGCGNLLYTTIAARVNMDQVVNGGLGTVFLDVPAGVVSSVLLVGMPRIGKTYSSCYLAQRLQFSQVQMVSTMATAYGRRDIQDALAKCKLTATSCLILDDLEGLLQWCDVGRVYDNSLYQCVRNACKTFLALDQKLVIIANTSNPMMVEALGLDRVFDKIMDC